MISWAVLQDLPWQNSVKKRLSARLSCLCRMTAQRTLRAETKPATNALRVENVSTWELPRPTGNPRTFAGPSEEVGPHLPTGKPLGDLTF